MKRLKLLGIIFLILAAVVAGIFFYENKNLSPVVDEKNLEASINDQAKKFIAKKKSYALVVGVVKNGKEYLKGYGTTEKGENILPDSTTIFELASTSKLFTTSVLQLLIDNGELKIDDKIQTILGEKVKLPAIAEKTTVQHLATHLSGFPSLPNSFMAKMTDETNPYKDLVTQDLYDYLKTCEGKQKEGSFDYSNFGMGLLGHLLELKSGIKYEQLVKERLLNKLGMNQTFVSIDKNNQSKIVQGFDEDGNRAPVWTDNVLTGAGSFLSNGADMMKFLKANLISMSTPFSNSLFATHLQQLNGETGLGWILASTPDQELGKKNIIWHNGMAGAYASFIAIDKANNFGVFVLSNKAVDVTELGKKLTESVRTQSWNDSTLSE